MFSVPDSPLSLKQRAGIGILLLLLILFGAWVELRGAFLKRPMTDLQVYLRAAYAVKTGTDLYAITDDNGWHYVYPPLFAILMTPLADPPKGQDRTGYLPYGFTVGFWYFFTTALGLLGCHILAKALEDTSMIPALSTPQTFSQRWWALRLIPFLILLPAIGRSQMRGQTGLIIAFLLCGMMASTIRGKSFKAGLWLSAAATIKVIPAFMFLAPLWRRDWKMLAGGFMGFVVTLIVIPILAMGTDRTINAYKTFYHEVLKAGIRGDTESSRGKELTCISCTDSNSPMTVMHNMINPDRLNRPKEALPIVRWFHWFFCIVLILITLYTARYKTNELLLTSTRPNYCDALFIGQLSLLMCVVSPVFHPHYVSMLLPFVTVILFVLWYQNGYNEININWKLIFWFLFISHILTAIGGVFWFLRDFGLVLLSTLTLWAGAISLMKGQCKHVHSG